MPPVPTQEQAFAVHRDLFDDESSDDDAVDTELLHQMLTNLLEKCHDPSAGSEEIDILIESERWAPALHVDERNSTWSSSHLTPLDFRTIEGVGGGQENVLAKHHRNNGGMAWSDPDESPLPDSRCWEWSQPAWSLLPDFSMGGVDADNTDHLALGCWWYGTVFPTTKTVEGIRRMDRARNEGVPSIIHFVRCRVWGRKRRRKHLAEVQKMLQYSMSDSAVLPVLDADTGGGGGGRGFACGGNACSYLIESLLKVRRMTATNTGSAITEASKGDGAEISPAVVLVPPFEVDAVAWIGMAEACRLDFIVPNKTTSGPSKATVATVQVRSFPASAFWALFSSRALTGRSRLSSMEREILRATAMVKRMTAPRKTSSARVPTQLLRRARGIALISTAKVGFLYSGAVGTGVVLARTTEGWSAPSSICFAQLGAGFQVGAEMGSLLLILNTDAAVRAFGGGQVTLGLEVGVSLGPIGGRSGGASIALGSSSSNQAPQRRNEAVEDLLEEEDPSMELSSRRTMLAAHGHGDIAEEEPFGVYDTGATATTSERECSSSSPILAYAHQKGLFVGLLSLEGSVILPRNHVNRKFYAAIEPPKSRNKSCDGSRASGRQTPPTPLELLSGSIPVPAAAAPLYNALIDAFDNTPEVNALAEALAVE